MNALTIKKIVLVLIGLVIACAGAGAALYAANATPVEPAITAAEAATTNKPYVVKLHARWCPICMTTKPIWAQIDSAYSGRVNLVVFDFTNQATTDRSRVEAARLGLEKFFDENAGWTGTISVLDSRTKQERVSIHGRRDFDEYRAAIDASLRDAITASR